MLLLNTLTNKAGFFAVQANFFTQSVAEMSGSDAGLVKISLTPSSWDRPLLSPKVECIEFDPILPQIVPRDWIKLFLADREANFIS